MQMKTNSDQEPIAESSVFHAVCMQHAIELAKNGEGFTNPNPLVGAVIAKNGKIIGEGWHERYGDLHAERNALKHCTEDPAGGTLYVTLEPCCHQGKQPPCTQAILESGIRRVFIGSRDPNPLVSGKGMKLLQAQGVEVVSDFFRSQCDQLNPIFFHYITSGLPYVILKYAMTADGKIACAGGASQWVTGEKARHHVQCTRKRVAAVCVGIGTVLADNPSLTCRCENPSQPVRVVLDTQLQIPLDCTLVQTAKEVPVLVFCSQPDPEKQAALEAAGVTVLEAALAGEHLSIFDCLKQLGQRKLDSVLIEGGAGVAGTVLQANCWDLLQVYIAPKIFGGDGLSPIGSLGITQPAEAISLPTPRMRWVGEDVLLEFERTAAGG